ncbi:peptidase S41 [Sulfolobus acidocaldarius SUSAZ]|nr:peptidase S41 [Sulfolobus acidocaldarius SUSAZ]
MKGYYMYPDIRNDFVAFTTDDDVWLTSLKDMRPIRVTTDTGVSIKPKISPDGKRIAFTTLWLRSGKQGADVFIVEDGRSKRVTYFNRPTIWVAGWLSDKEIVVITDYHTPFNAWTEAYKVNVNDESYEPLPFGIVSNISIKKETIVIARGYQDLPFWKGYRGGTKGELWISFDAGETFKKFLSLNGIISHPMILNDRVYFLSDHESVSNLYSVDMQGENLLKHTNFSDYYCRNASSDGKRIVFQRAGDIYLFDPQTNNTVKLEIEVFTERKKKRPKFVSTMEYLTDVDVNQNYIGLVVRGKPFIMRPWEGPVLQLGEKQGVKYRELQILSNEDIAVVDSNENKLLILSKDGNIKQKVEKDFGRIEKIKASPDGKKLLISNNRLELWLYDLESKKEKLIDKSSYGIIREFDWHPSGEWFSYAFPEGSRTQSIKIANVSGNTIRVTSPYAFDFSPSFDPDGKFLYFLSARTLDPSSDKFIFNMSFQRVIKPYLVVLNKAYSPFNQPLDEVKHDKNVDPEGIQYRAIPFPVEEDNYVKISGAKSNKVLLYSQPIRGQLNPQEDTLGKIEIFDIETKSKEVFAENVKNFIITKDGSKVLLVFKDSIRLVNATIKPDLSTQGIKGGVVDTTRIKVLVDPEKEWRQMLFETWKLMKENYWSAEKLQGWDSVLGKYEKLLDRVSTRYELSDVLKEMQGETKTSHSYETPYDFETAEPLVIGGLGAEFNYDEQRECFKIFKIYSGDPTNEGERSPLKDPGVELNEGDCIHSIDGEKVRRGSINSYFINKDQAILEVLTNDGKSRTVSVRLMKDEKYLMYRHWVEKNREYVHKVSDGKLGYVHVPDMMYQGFAEFFRLFISEFYRQGLIVDVRFNRGGFISGLILQRLLLRREGYDVPRNGERIPFPYLSSPKVIVAVTNENAGSDGDIFSYLFKRYKIGMLIGRRTWGGVIGISPRHLLVDKTVVTQPEFAAIFDEVGLGIENYGVDPDIEVDNYPQDYRIGNDRQLDKAIEIALKQMDT